MEKSIRGLVRKAVISAVHPLDEESIVLSVKPSEEEMVVSMTSSEESRSVFLDLYLRKGLLR